MKWQKSILLVFLAGFFESAQAQDTMVFFDGALTAWKLPALQEQAEAGNTEAQFGLGRVYWYGDGSLIVATEAEANEKLVDQDYYKAVIWFEEAAKKGESRAQDYLGLAYASGAGGKSVDLKQAFEWFEKSALKNNLCAQIHLAQAYAKGAGVKKDCHRANYWVNQTISSPEWQGKKWLVDCDEKSETLKQIEQEGLECTD